MLLRHGRDWGAIAGHLPNKLEAQCKNFYHNNKKRLHLDAIIDRHARLREEGLLTSDGELAEGVDEDEDPEDDPGPSDDDDKKDKGQGQGQSSAKDKEKEKEKKPGRPPGRPPGSGAGRKRKTSQDDVKAGDNQADNKAAKRVKQLEPAVVSVSVVTSPSPAPPDVCELARPLQYNWWREGRSCC
jgi:hypothetical protein